MKQNTFLSMCRVAFEEKRLLADRIRTHSHCFICCHPHCLGELWTKNFRFWKLIIIFFLVAMRLFNKSVSQKPIELDVLSKAVRWITLILILTFNILFIMQLLLLITLLITFLTGFGKCEHDEEGVEVELRQFWLD